MKVIKEFVTLGVTSMQLKPRVKPISVMLLEKYAQQRRRNVFERLGGVKRQRSPECEEQSERRELGKVFRGAVMQNLEWSMARGHGIVWSKTCGAKQGGSRASKSPNHIMMPGGHDAQVWRRRANESGSDSEESRDEGDAIAVGTVPCKITPETREFTGYTRGQGIVNHARETTGSTGDASVVKRPRLMSAEGGEIVKPRLN
jgi:hypothetical protein